MKHFFKLLILFIGTSVFAQDLNKVTINELKETNSTLDANAVAETLFSKAYTSFYYTTEKGYMAVMEMSYKIKILKKEGLKYANIQVPFYNERTNSETVLVSNAVTYNLVDGNIEKTKLKSSEEFTVKENDNWKIKKFVLPNVKEGSIIEYKIKLTTPFIWNLNTWNFQQDIPVRYSYFKFQAPSALRYQHYIKGFIPVEIKNQYEYYEYIAKDLPALKDEAFTNNIENYRTSLRLELSAFERSNGMLEHYSNSWESLVKKIYDGEFGQELNRTKYFGNDLQNIVKDKVDRDAKIEAIFNFVQSNFKWNGKRGYNPDLGVREAYKQRVGNTADINLILIAMLRESGLQANPILLSTRDHGIALFPSHSAFNYVIAAVEIQNGLILLDATSKNSRINILPFQALNWVGRIIRESGSSSIVELIPKILSVKNQINIIDLAADGSVTGNKRIKLTNYEAFRFREKYGQLNLQSISNSVQNDYKNIEIEEFDVKNIQNLNQDIDISYKFKLTNVADVIGDQIFFEPSFIFNLKSNPFLDENRKFSVDFIYKYKESDMYAIKIPEGYEVEYLPKSIQIKMNSNNYNVKWILSSDKDKIVLRINEEVNSSVIIADEYIDLKSAFEEFAKIQNEKIILKKIKE